MKATFYQPFDTERLEASQKTLDGNNDHRSPFQIDRDRIIFSYPFRRLQSKTQVFQIGEYDFYRTRLTHSIEVARIGRSICDYLRTQGSSQLQEGVSIDSDLTEAVGLAHDLGHPPFGHIGEHKLNELMASYGGFEGNAQTLRILTELIYNRDTGPCGMNPTRAFLDGVLKYKLLFKEQCAAQHGTNTYPKNYFLFDDQSRYLNFAFGGEPFPVNLAGRQKLNHFRSIECQIMDWADDTAYSLHDILDGVKAGFLTPEKITLWADTQERFSSNAERHIEELIGVFKKGNIEARFSNKIGTFIRACRLDECENFMSARTQRYRYRLKIDPAAIEECHLYKKLASDLIFESPEIKQIEFKRGLLIEKLFKAIFENYVERPLHPLRLLPLSTTRWIEAAETEQQKARRACDYLASLTDPQAIHLYKRLYDPEFGSIADLV